MVMLLARLSWPPTEPPAPYCGVSLAISVMRPEIVGSVARSSRITEVAAPERVVLNTGSEVPTTVTVSVDACRLQREVEVLGHAQRQRDVVPHVRGESPERRRHMVGSADAQTLHQEAAVSLGDGFVCAARRLVDGYDCCSGRDLALAVLDHARNCGGGHALTGGNTGRPRQPRAHED